MDQFRPGDDEFIDIVRSPADPEGSTPKQFDYFRADQLLGYQRLGVRLVRTGLFFAIGAAFTALIGALAHHFNPWVLVVSAVAVCFGEAGHTLSDWAYRKIMEL